MPDFEAHVPQALSPRQTVHTQRDVAFRPIHVMLERLDCALADHQLDDLAHGSFRGGSRCHDAAVAQHGDAVGDLPNLVQPVADVKDGRSRVAEAPEMSEGQRDLTLREGRGRLVEDEDTARVREGRCERNQLLPANAEPTHGHLRIDIVQPDGGERCRRPRPERCRGQESEATGKIREEQILGDAQRRNEVQLLRHELHARPLRFLPASGTIALTGERHGAAVRRGQPADDPGERRLARSVRPHQRVDDAPAKIEVQLDQDRRRVPLLDAAHLQQRFRDVRLLHQRGGTEIRSTGVCMSSGFASPRKIRRAYSMP